MRDQIDFNKLFVLPKTQQLLEHVLPKRSMRAKLDLISRLPIISPQASFNMTGQTAADGRICLLLADRALGHWVISLRENHDGDGHQVFSCLAVNESARLKKSPTSDYEV